jgi:putative FmdB family regulatory protein
MPIYEYQCLRCEKKTELLQRFDDPPLASCPDCGGEVRKLISSPAFHFKGSGWYVTDYGKKGGAETSAAKGEGAAQSEGGTHGEGGTQSEAGAKGDGGSKSDGAAADGKSASKEPAAAPAKSAE